MQGAPELLEFATKKKSAKQALKSTVKKTAKKQIGGSLQRGQKAVYRKKSTSMETYKKVPTKEKDHSSKSKPTKESIGFLL